LVSGPVVLTPKGRAYQFAGELAVGRLLAGETDLPTYLVRPAGLEPATTGLEGRFGQL
jgi:hypothetical protein